MSRNPAATARNFLETLGIDNIPSIDISDLIIYHDGIVIEKDLRNSDGKLVMKNGRSIVTVDSKIEFSQRRRYVLAYELGHMLLHPDKATSFTDDDTTIEGYRKGPQEKEANDFAAELLMPEKLFSEACKEKKFSPSLISELSEKFNTSMTSTVYRYIDLGNHPIAASYSKLGKIQYWKKSKDMYYRIPDFNKLPIQKIVWQKSF